MTKHILVVDDEMELAELIAFDLESEGYTTKCARNCEEAFTFVQTESFDLVLSDVRMPKCDGISLLKKIKTLIPTMPVLLITGHTDISEQSAIQAGALAMLRKPDDLSRIAALVTKYLTTPTP